jgi:molecular chaperone DnaK
MYLGIDLGTSNSAVVGNDKGELKLFKTTDGYDVLPSAIMIDRRGAMFVGKRAYDQDAFSPEDVGKRFKRLMGTASPITFKSAKRAISPEEASSEVLKALLAQAHMVAGEFEIDGAIVTVPAAFNQMQSEATMRSAHAAGIDKVGLLQEPVAAAMASIADRRKKNAALTDGQFLVYDLGGGTFDVAVVQSIGGTVNIVAHAGVNMLGGTDFDRTIVNSIVRSWLIDNFALPSDFQKQPAYERVLRIAAYCAEKAKIELSSRPVSSISADESQLGARDSAGKEIYLDIPLARTQLEALIMSEIDRSIDECRKLLSANGYEPSDIDRLAFIGGPTRMPIIRSRVPQQLGIPADLDTDPMTAVATGAAIFAESRDWTSGASKAKASRGSVRTSGPIKIEYGYPSRTSEDRIRIKIAPAEETIGRGYRLQIDSDMGWTSGQLPLDTTTTVEDVPVARRDDNQYRVIIFDGDGSPLTDAETRFVVKRVEAAAVGTPATHALGVKVVEGNPGSEQNILDPLVPKGEPLPARGVKNYRAAKDLKAGDDGFLDFEVFQMEEGVTDPKLTLHVGAFRISSGDLERGDIIHRGDRIRVYWTLDENGLLNCALEIDSVGRRYDTGKMFIDQGAQKNFEGKDGEEIATSVLDLTQAELEQLRGTLGDRVGDETANLQLRINRQRDNLNASYEADARRSITEEARNIRQDISKIRESPENIGTLLRAEINAVSTHFNAAIRPRANAAVSERFEKLAQQAREAVAQGKIADAKRSLAEMRSVSYEELYKDPGFVINSFLKLAQERHLALDKGLHDRTVEAGKASAARQDLNGVQRAINQIIENRIPTSPKSGSSDGLAGLMRW